jgi:hypothetical protein
VVPVALLFVLVCAVVVVVPKTAEGKIHMRQAACLEAVCVLC